MKNRFLFVFMLLLFGMGTMVAQTPEKYWTLETYPGYWASGNMTATFLIYVDGEMLDDPNIELGAFINGMLVANGSMPSDYTPPRPYPEYDMVLNGFSNEDSEDANGNMIDFQLYDHSTGEILPYYAPQQVKFFLDWVASQPGHPIILNFFTGETQWEKVTANDLQVGDLVIITGSETDVALNQNQAGNYRKGHAIERVGNTITWLPADPDEEEFDPQFVLIHQYNSYNSTSTDVQLFVSTGYLYASSNTADQLRTFRNELANDFEEPNSLWSITVDEDGIASLVAQGPNSHNVMQLNPSNERFLCFTSNSKEDLNLYRLTLYTAPTTFDVTVTATEGGTAIGGQEDVEAGTEITVTATPIDCYNFAGWMVNDEIVSTEAEYTFTVDADIALVATFEKVDFEVTFAAEPADVVSISNDPIIVDCGEFVNEPVYTIDDDCYVFDKWTVNGEEIDLATYAITANVDIIANFVKQTFEATFVAEPADVVDMTEAIATVECGDFAPDPEFTITDDCYEFLNWTVNGEEIDLATYAIEDDVTITANYAKKEFEVTFVAEPADVATLPAEAATVECGAFATAPEYTITDECYEFVNWTVNGDEIDLAAYAIEGDVTITANFAKKEFEVTFVAEPADVATMPAAAQIECGELANPSYEDLDECYSFVNWTVNDVEIDPATYVVNEAVEIIAHFELNKYDVTYTANPAEAATMPEAEEVNCGETVNPTYTMVEGYEFENWTINGDVIDLPYEVTEDVELVANFIQLEYNVNITANPVEGGTAAINEAGPYHYGDEITLTATPAEGYQFVNFTIGTEEITSPYTVTGDAEIVANFLEESVTLYTITVVAEPAEGGIVSGAGTYPENEVVTLSATANTGYDFMGWKLNGEIVSTDAEYQFAVTENADYIAVFEIQTVEIVVTDGEGGTHTMNGTGTYNYGEEVTITATPDEGYRFVGFIVGSETITDNPYTFNATENLTIEVSFELIPNYMVTIAANPAEAATFDVENGEVAENTELTITATMTEGYRFLNWTVNGEVQDETGLSLTVTVTEAMDIVANFELIPEIVNYMVTIAANPAEAATFNMENGEIEENTEITVIATMAEGYTFLNWTINGEVQDETELTLTVTVTEDMDIVANFEEVIVPPTEYTVTLLCSPVAGGTTEGAGTYEEGTSVTVKAIVNEGYEFVNWTVNTEVVSTEAEYTFDVTADITLVANFHLIPVVNYYMVNFEVNPEEAGTVDQESGEFEEGSEVTVTATAAEGYEFLNWTVNGTETEGEENVLTFTVTEEMTVVANFELIPVIVEYNITIDEIENGTVSAPATSPAGETVTVTVTPNPMYVLISLYYYTTDPEETTDIDLNTKQFVMPEADVTIGAEFMLVTGKGDVNLDGEVNILDVLTALNYILEKNPQPFDFDQADMNEDGDIDISDVMAINAMILGLKADCEGDYAVYQVIDNKLYIDANMALAGYQFRLTAEPTVIDMPGFATAGNWSNGEYIFVIYNLSGEKASGLYAILDLGDANVNNVVMSTKEGCQVRGVEGTVSVNSFDETAYTVFPVPANSNVRVAGPGLNEVEVYNTMGQRVMVVNDINADETVINVMSLTPGSYLFRIITNNGVTTKNVIVVR